MPNFTDMLSKAKEMQEKMKEAQEKIKNIEVEGEAGPNLVKVILSGDYELKSIILSDPLLSLLKSQYHSRFPNMSDHSKVININRRTDGRSI